MATLKEKTPAILPLKSDLVPVDRKMQEEESHESEEAPAPKRCNVEEDDAFDVLFGNETSSVGLPQGSHDVDMVEEEQGYLKEGEINFRKEDPTFGLVEKE